MRFSGFHYYTSIQRIFYFYQSITPDYCNEKQQKDEQILSFYKQGIKDQSSLSQYSFYIQYLQQQISKKLEMNCVKKLSLAPLKYLADLRRLTYKQYLHIGTNFSPSYPIMIFTALTFTLVYCALILYFVFTQPNGPCFTHIRGAVYILAILYPLETILCFVCMTGTIALSKNRCWKVTWMLLFGPILCGFGFGEVGLVQACVLQKSQIIIIPGIFTKPGFLDAMVYLYITFLCLYFILIPTISFLYKRQQEDIKKQLESSRQKSQKDGGNSEPIKPASTGCQKCMTVTFYFLHILLFIAFGFVILIKIFGPCFYTYLWLQTVVNIGNLITPLQKFMLASLLLAYFAPISIMLITLGVQSIVKLCRGKKVKQPQINELQTQSASSARARDTWNPKEPKIDMTEGLARKSVSLGSNVDSSYQKKNTLSSSGQRNEDNFNIQDNPAKSKKEALL